MSGTAENEKQNTEERKKEKKKGVTGASALITRIGDYYMRRQGMATADGVVWRRGVMKQLKIKNKIGTAVTKGMANTAHDVTTQDRAS